jgi:hypothetical protein
MNYVFLSTIFFSIFLIIPVIVIYSITLRWIDKLEKTKCKCSEDYKRDYIKYYLYVYLALVGLNILFMIFFSNANSKILKSFKPLIMAKKYIMPIFTIINMVFSIMYITKLKELDCKCSEDIIREVYYYWNIIMIAMTAITLLFPLIIVGIQSLYLYSKK